MYDYQFFLQEINKDNSNMDTKSTEGNPITLNEPFLEENSEDNETGPRQGRHSDLDPENNTDVVNTEHVNDSPSSNQHRKTLESIATENAGENAQHENKQTKTLMGNHNSKSRRRKKLRKT